MHPSKLLTLVFFGCCLFFAPVIGLAGSIRILAPDLPGASEAGGKGRDAETVRRVLQRCGHEAEFLIQPFGRHIHTYRESDKADAVMTVPLATELPGGSTAAYIWYQNGAVYDANRIEQIASLNDLSGKDVVTFKNGVALLGLEGARFGSILEIANQRIHSHLLLLGRVDAILADGMIVAEINRRILTSSTGLLELDRVPDLRFVPIFAPAPFKLVFRDSSLAEAFDHCYNQAYADGVMKEIDDKYIYRFRRALGNRYLGY